MKRTILKFSIFMSCTLGVNSGYSIDSLSDSEIKEIKELLQESVGDRKTPGISISIVSGDKFLFEGAAGFKDLDSKSQMTPNTLFGSGSISKPVTAITNMKLLETQQMSMDETLGAFFPKMATPISQLTLHDVLSQTSGYPEFFGKTSLLASMVYQNGEAPVISDSWDSLVEFLNLGKDLSLAEPGIRFSYNNDYYTLLGKIYENRFNQSFGALVREKIFNPIRMRRSGYSKSTLLQDSDIITGYLWQNQKWNCGDFPFSVIGESSGGLWTSSHELGLLLQEILKSYHGESQFLSKTQLETMWKPYSEVNWGFGSGDKASYGYGWRIAKNRLGHTFYYHGGDFMVSGSYIIIVPELNFAIAIGMNSSPGNIATNITKNLMDIVSRTALNSKLSKYAGNYASIKDYLKAQVSVQNNHELLFDADFPKTLGGKQQLVFEIEDLSESLFSFTHPRVGKLKAKFLCNEDSNCNLLFDRFFMAGRASIR